jgi:hypothetical protein
MFGGKRRRVIEAEANLAIKRQNAALANENYVRALENQVEKCNNLIAAQERVIEILKQNVPPDFLAVAEEELKRLNAAQTRG